MKNQPHRRIGASAGVEERGGIQLYRLLRTERRWQTADGRRQTADGKTQIPSSKIQIPNAEP